LTSQLHQGEKREKKEEDAAVAAARRRNYTKPSQRQAVAAPPFPCVACSTVSLTGE
jgi:hypothetical protein